MKKIVAYIHSDSHSSETNRNMMSVFPHEYTVLPLSSKDIQSIHSSDADKHFHITSKDKTERVDAIVVGETKGKKKKVLIQNIKAFKGIHATYEEALQFSSQMVEHKNIMVMGGGTSAMNTLRHISSVSKHANIIHVIRHPRWVVPWKWLHGLIGVLSFFYVPAELLCMFLMSMMYAWFGTETLLPMYNLFSKPHCVNEQYSKGAFVEKCVRVLRDSSFHIIDEKRIDIDGKEYDVDIIVQAIGHHLPSYSYLSETMKPNELYLNHFHPSYGYRLCFQPTPMAIQMMMHAFDTLDSSFTMEKNDRYCITYPTYLPFGYQYYLYVRHLCSHWSFIKRFMKRLIQDLIHPFF